MSSSCRAARQTRLGALLLQYCQTPQQRLAGAGGHQRRILAKQLRVITQVVEQCLEVLEVQQQQAFAVCHLERRIRADCWLSVSSSKLPSNNGPISLMVVRNG